MALLFCGGVVVPRNYIREPLKALQTRESLTLQRRREEGGRPAGCPPGWVCGDPPAGNASHGRTPPSGPHDSVVVRTLRHP